MSTCISENRGCEFFPMALNSLPSVSESLYDLGLAAKEASGAFVDLSLHFVLDKPYKREWWKKYGNGSNQAPRGFFK